MAQDQEVVIVGADGTEHVFPPGFDPKRAAAIVRGGGASSQSTTSPSPPLPSLDDTQSVLGNLVVGAGKGAASTVLHLGELVHKIPGVTAAVDALYGVPGLSQRAFAEGEQATTATTPAQKVGKVTEQIGEVFVPGSKVSQATKAWSLVPRMAAEGALGAGTALVQQSDPVTGAVLGAAGPPVGTVIGPVADYIGSKAVPLVRAGLKAPISVMKQQAGAGLEGVNAAANRLATWMVANRVTTAGRATQIVKNAEADIQRILADNPEALTDAPDRVLRYLDLFKQRAAKTLNPDQAAAVAGYADDLVQRGPIGETVTQTVLRPSPTGVVDASGNVVQTPTTVQTRELRAAMPADEALTTARETSQFQTGRQWGEQKGVVMEATKTAERAVRDAVKQALPEVRTPLQQQGQAILARSILERQAYREANRDVVSLPGLVAANANIVLGLAAHWLRNNQVRAGIYANDLAKAVASRDAATAAAVLDRLGIGIGSQVTQQPVPVSP